MPITIFSFTSTPAFAFSHDSAQDAVMESIIRFPPSPSENMKSKSEGYDDDSTQTDYIPALGTLSPNGFTYTHTHTHLGDLWTVGGGLSSGKIVFLLGLHEVGGKKKKGRNSFHYVNRKRAGRFTADSAFSDSDSSVPYCTRKAQHGWPVTYISASQHVSSFPFWEDFL